MVNIIPDEHHVVRYCKPRQTKDGWPTLDAFHLRPIDEGALSVNWLEFFTAGRVVDTRGDRKGAITEVREKIHMDLSHDGLFAVLNVESLKKAIEAGGGQSPYVKHDPQGAKPAEGRRPKRPPDPSHTLAYGYQVADLDVAVQLLALVGPDDVYPGRICGPTKEEGDGVLHRFNSVPLLPL